MLDLPLTPREAQCVFRALLDYRRSLNYSQIFDTQVVREEIDAADEVMARINLLVYAPEGGDE